MAWHGVEPLTAGVVLSVTHIRHHSWWSGLPHVLKIPNCLKGSAFLSVWWRQLVSIFGNEITSLWSRIKAFLDSHEAAFFRQQDLKGPLVPIIHMSTIAVWMGCFTALHCLLLIFPHLLAFLYFLFCPRKCLHSSLLYRYLRSKSIATENVSPSLSPGHPHVLSSMQPGRGRRTGFFFFFCDEHCS